MGQLIFNKEFQQMNGYNKISVDLGEKATGIYIVKLQTTEGVFTKRVVVE